MTGERMQHGKMYEGKPKFSFTKIEKERKKKEKRTQRQNLEN